MTQHGRTVAGTMIKDDLMKKHKKKSKREVGHSPQCLVVLGPMIMVDPFSHSHSVFFVVVCFPCVFNITSCEFVLKSLGFATPWMYLSLSSPHIPLKLHQRSPFERLEEEEVRKRRGKGLKANREIIFQHQHKLSLTFLFF